MLFFFQAEDGIRDIGVTGVQTCALPILENASAALLPPPPPTPSSQGADSSVCLFSLSAPGPVSPLTRPSLHASWSCFSMSPLRSEERRVGEESRSRWSPYL